MAQSTNFDEVSDKKSIKKNAANIGERRLALDVCLNQYWVGHDITDIERVDTGDWHGWRKWPRQAT